MLRRRERSSAKACVPKGRTVLCHETAAPHPAIHRPTQFHQAPLECGGVNARWTKPHLAKVRRTHRPPRLTAPSDSRHSTGKLTSIQPSQRNPRSADHAQGWTILESIKHVEQKSPISHRLSCSRRGAPALDRGGDRQAASMGPRSFNRGRLSSDCISHFRPEGCARPRKTVVAGLFSIKLADGFEKLPSASLTN